MKGLCRRILEDFDYRDAQRLCMHYRKTDGSLVRCGGIDRRGLVRAVCDLYSADVVEDAWIYGGEHVPSESSSSSRRRPDSNEQLVEFRVSSEEDPEDIATSVAMHLGIDESEVLVLRTGGPS